MKLVRLRLSNFRSFGPEVTEIDLDDMTYLLGPNGAGKTAVLQALARMFSLNPAQRVIRRSDFHIPHNESPDDAPDERSFWLEADFEFPELLPDDEEGEEEEDDDLPGVPSSFAHMQLISEDGPASVRFRLAATIDEDGDIEETFTYVSHAEEDGTPLQESRVAKQDRNAIQVHYLPARRDPAEHISYSANALLGRALRAADWSTERENIKHLTDQITDALSDNAAVDGITEALTREWSSLHSGQYYANPSLSFASSEIESLLKHLTVGFTPGHGDPEVDFSRLSDGEQSLLYVSLVLTMHGIGTRVLAGDLDDAFDIHKLRPALFTLIAIEEPENSLSPHYLGRVVKAVTEFASGRDAQAIVATHSPSLLRRVPPESIRYLRLNEARKTAVKTIVLPDDDDEEEQKFVREAVLAFPELYFSRLVVLGEGDSEEIVLPRMLAARGILADDASISVVPLGGRHVNHFWRLLRNLDIPHVTLLDLDLARFGGGWGRIKYAAKQLRKYGDVANINITQAQINVVPAWNSDLNPIEEDDGWFDRLEGYGVFFSAPLDLDFLMMTTYPDAYEIDGDSLEEPEDATLKSVLGKSHAQVDGKYTDEEQAYFDAYHDRFKLGSKPVAHITALAALDDDELLQDMPGALDRLLDHVVNELEGLPE